MRAVLFPALVAVALVATVVSAQEQQAGNDASTNADETFRQLMEQCDDIEALTLRARFRLQIERTTPEARQEAEPLFEQGLAECGEGDLEVARATLQQALDIAAAGAQEIFDEQAAAAAAEEEAAEETAAADAAGGEAEEGGLDMMTMGALAVLLAAAAFFFMRRRSG